MYVPPQSVLASLSLAGNWTVDWIWGLPLIVVNVVIHVLCLGFINQRALRLSGRIQPRLHPTGTFALIIGSSTLLAACLHGVEAGVWALAYRILGALPDDKSAILYSLNAITSFGHTGLDLTGHWQLMGAMEALNGWLLFGLTTAFLFSMIDKIPVGRRASELSVTAVETG